MEIIQRKKIKAGAEYIDAVSLPLMDKHLVVLRGRRGYVMCGYLNLDVAEKFQDVAVMVTGVSSIDDAVRGTVSACTTAAKKRGIYIGQPIRDVLSEIA